MQVLITGTSLCWQGKAGDLMPFLRALAQRHELLRDLLCTKTEHRYLTVKQTLKSG